jgi:hypothetical protein
MKHICTKCNEGIDAGKDVVQMMRGPWLGRITPGCQEVFAEWHWPRCFGSEFSLGSQIRPYQCLDCGKDVRLQERITFFVKGEETGEDHTFSERRGYRLYNVKHYPQCP